MGGSINHDRPHCKESMTTGYFLWKATVIYIIKKQMIAKEDFFNYLLEMSEKSNVSYLFYRIFLRCDNEKETIEFLKEKGMELDELLNHFKLDYDKFRDYSYNLEYDYSNKKINKLLDDEYNSLLYESDEEWDSHVAEFHAMIKQFDRDWGFLDRQGYLIKDSRRIVSVLRKYSRIFNEKVI